MKLVPYILYIYLITFHETILSDIISIYGVILDIPLIIIVLVALYKTEDEAVRFAFCVGIVISSTAIGTMPYKIAILTIIAVIVNQLSVRINLESIASRIIILGSAVLLYRAINALFTFEPEFFYILIRYILPAVAYSLVAGLVFFMIKDRLITWQKIKALF
jgi:rod shape-determining protein MreD